MSKIARVLGREVADEIDRLRERYLLEGAMATSALVAMADRRLLVEESLALGGIVENVELLKIYDPREAVQWKQDRTLSRSVTGDKNWTGESAPRGTMVHYYLAEGAEDLGLAVMLRDLLGQNLEQNPHKMPDFIKLHIPIGLTVSDVDIELTMVFSGGGEPEKKKPQQRSAKKIGRNAPCPCGSGKKYKKCCGK